MVVGGIFFTVHLRFRRRLYRERKLCEQSGDGVPACNAAILRLTVQVFGRRGCLPITFYGKFVGAVSEDGDTADQGDGDRDRVGQEHHEDAAETDGVQFLSKHFPHDQYAAHQNCCLNHSSRQGDGDRDRVGQEHHEDAAETDGAEGVHCIPGRDEGKRILSVISMPLTKTAA